MPPRFRDATPADVPALHALVERAYRGEAARTGWTHEADLLGGQRTDPAMLAALLADPRHAMPLAFDPAGVLLGCVSITQRADRLAYLGMLTVDPARQAAGLGRALLAEGERVAATRFGATRIEMTVIVQRPELIAWYERRGYCLTGETRPFPHGDARFGVPVRPDLAFVVLDKLLG
ncbi:GNAT family N-acetyltransferase [Sphingomonas baiyangensis]|uniref:GNAT family N-acetyltransferase n=1 Tax=Sphingomonas baiyangensis TaxID=2572576 RepID=A0A4U1LA36_9SPHN|nr:GNAT family N-acetyltransferase [Sphingomonas baiyangensis]TKD53280.1 GNAT family N-acetyltransferase [Sphingomonas baiyangensis]